MKRHLRLLPAALVIQVGFVCTASPCAAESAARPPLPSPSDPGVIAPVDPAEAAYERALAQYSAGDRTSALASMRESYRLSQKPELLYNIARMEGELDECAAALTHYTEYLERVPQGRYRDSAEQAIAELSPRCSVAPPHTTTGAAATAPTTTAVVATKASSPPPLNLAPNPSRSRSGESGTPYWSTQRWIGWSAIAAGAAGSVGAVYFALEAKESRDAHAQNVDDAYHDRASYDETLLQDQRRNQRWARALGITGGALIVGGAVLVLLAPSHVESTSTAAVYAAPGLVGGSFTSRF